MEEKSIAAKKDGIEESVMCCLAEIILMCDETDTRQKKQNISPFSVINIHEKTTCMSKVALADLIAGVGEEARGGK